jgi:hypothetical protein
MAVKLTHLQLIYGVAGAREKFEELVGHLIHSERTDINRVRVFRGDGGIDVHSGSLSDSAGLDVFQIKFFPDAIGEAQQNQIRESFKRVHENTSFVTKTWTLCLPIDMSIGEKKWFDEWKIKQVETGIEIKPVWGALKLEGLLYEERNRHIREQFFKEEHLRLIREMQGTLEKLVQDFDERIPKPVPLVLRPHLVGVSSRRSYIYDAESIVVEIQLNFEVENVSALSVANWKVPCRISGIPEENLFTRQSFSKIGSGLSYMRMNSTILPTQSLTTEIIFGLKICKAEAVDDQVRRLLQDATVTYHAISDNHVGEDLTTNLSDKIDWNYLLNGVKQSTQAENIVSL